MQFFFQLPVTSFVLDPYEKYADGRKCIVMDTDKWNKFIEDVKVHANEYIRTVFFEDLI